MHRLSTAGRRLGFASALGLFLLPIGLLGCDSTHSGTSSAPATDSTVVIQPDKEVHVETPLADVHVEKDSDKTKPKDVDVKVDVGRKP